MDRHLMLVVDHSPLADGIVHSDYFLDLQEKKHVLKNSPETRKILRGCKQNA
jgi:hypothetical protein